MARYETFDEQWTDRISAAARRYKVRVQPLPPGSWKLQPRNYEFDPCLVFWGMIGFPDLRFEQGAVQTMWFAFRHPPQIQREQVFHDGEAIVIGELNIMRQMLIDPGKGSAIHYLEAYGEARVTFGSDRRNKMGGSFVIAFSHGFHRHGAGGEQVK
jgi:hypothetical protein